MYFSEINVGVEKVGNADEDEDSDNGVVVAVDDSAVVAVDGGAVVAVADSAISSSKTFQYSASVALAACFPGRDVGAGYFLHSSPISAKMSSDVEGVDEDDVDEDDEDEDVAFATVVDSFNPQYISSSSMRAETDLNSVLLLAMILLSVTSLDATILGVMDGAEDAAVECADADSEATDLDLLFCCLACFAELCCSNPARDANAAFRDAIDEHDEQISVEQPCIEHRAAVGDSEGAVGGDADSVVISAAKPCSARSNMFGLLLTSIANCEKQ